ncbi:Retrovirus-related Pol polyprotein from transposon RE1 [Bienertia sinuspersici]
MTMSSKATVPTCSACGKTRHIREKCWTIIGYSSWFGKQGEGRGRGREQEVKKDTSTGITAEQLEQLLKLLPPPLKQGGGDTDEEMDCNYAGMVKCYSAKIAESKWIINSGVTHHMTGYQGKWSTCKKFKSEVRIDLLTCHTTLVTHKGEVQINENVRLKNVMLVPSFKHNLISVQKLIEDNSFELKFIENLCIIKEKDTDLLKGIDRAEKGLYIFLHDSVRGKIEEY